MRTEAGALIRVVSQGYRHGPPEVLAALESLNATGITLLVVTHDDEVAARSRRQVRMRDGRVVHDAPTPGAAT